MNNEEFSDEYKRIFDEIKASDSLKAKVLAQKSKRRSIKPAVAAMSTAAAALVIFAAVQNYSFDRDDSGVIRETVVSGTQSPAASAQPYVNEPEQSAVKTEREPTVTTAPRTKTTADYKKEAVRSISTLPPVKSQRSIEGSKEIQTSVPRAEIKTTETPKAESATEYAAPQPEIMENSIRSVHQTVMSDSGAAALNKASGNTVLRMNSRSALDSILSGGTRLKAAAAFVNAKEEEYETEYHTEKWDNEKYFDYLGIDIINDIQLPEDMKYEGDDECYFSVDDNGIPKNDTRIFAFSGDDGRYASILTSKDSSIVDSVLDSPEIEKSTVEDVEAAAFEENSSYFFYAKNEEASYVITTEELNGEEAADLLTSIGD